MRKVFHHHHSSNQTLTSHHHLNFIIQKMTSSSSSCSEACSQLWEQFKLVKLELLIIFIIMIPNSLPLTVDAKLQQDTYGKDEFYTYSGILSTIQGVTNLVVAPLVGSLSDFYGRTKPVVFCLIAYTIPAILVVITDNYWVYYISRSVLAWWGPAFSVAAASVIDKFQKHDEDLEGLLATNDDAQNSEEHQQQQSSAGNNINRSSNDISSPENNNNSEEPPVEQEEPRSMERTQAASGRIRSLSLAVLAFVVGLLFGSVVGTAIEDIRKKFIVMLALDVFAIVFVAVVGVSDKPPVMQEVLENAVVEETHHQNRNQQDADDENNSNENSALIISSASPNNNLTRTSSVTGVDIKHAKNSKEKIIKMLTNKNLMIACAIVFLDFLAEQALQSLLLLYIKNQLHLGSKDQQVLLFVLGAGSVVALLFSIRVLTHYFSLMTTLRLALVVNSLSISLCGLAIHAWQIFAIPSLSVVGVLVFPSMTSIASLTADDEDSGAAVGIVTASRFLAEGLSPTIFGIFLQHMENTEYPGPGLPFLVCGLFPLIGCGLSFLLPKHLGEKKKRD